MKRMKSVCLIFMITVMWLGAVQLPNFAVGEKFAIFEKYNYFDYTVVNTGTQTYSNVLQSNLNANPAGFTSYYENYKNIVPTGAKDLTAWFAAIPKVDYPIGDGFYEITYNSSIMFSQKDNPDFFNSLTVSIASTRHFVKAHDGEPAETYYTYTKSFSVASYKLDRNAKRLSTFVDTFIAQEGTYPNGGFANLPQGDFYYVKSTTLLQSPTLSNKIGTKAVTISSNSFMPTLSLKDIYIGKAFTVKYKILNTAGQLVTAYEVIDQNGTITSMDQTINATVNFQDIPNGNYKVYIWATDGYNLESNQEVYDVAVAKPFSLVSTNSQTQQTTTTLFTKLNYVDTNPISTYIVKYNVKTSTGQLASNPEVELTYGLSNGGTISLDKTIDMSSYIAGNYTVTLWATNGHNLRTNDVVYNVKITKPTILAITNTPSQQTAANLPIKLNCTDANTVSTYTVKYSVKTAGGQLITGAEVVLSTGTTNGGVIPIDTVLDLSAYSTGDYIVTLWAINGHNLRTNDVVYNVKVAKPLSLTITNTPSQQTSTSLPIKLNLTDANTVSTYTVKYNVKNSSGQLVSTAEVILSSGTINGGVLSIDNSLDMSTYTAGDYTVTIWAINGYNLKTNDVVYNVKITKPTTLAITNTPNQQTATSLPIKLNYSDFNTISTYTVKYNVKTSGGQLVSTSEVVLSNGTTNRGVIAIDKTIDLSANNTGDYIVTLWAINGHNLRTNDVVYNLKITKPTTLAITNATSQQTATNLPLKINYTDTNTVSTFSIKYNVKTSAGQLVTGAEVVLSTGTTNGSVIPVDKVLDMSTYNTGDYIVTIWATNGHNLRTNDVVYNVKIAKPLSLAITNTPSQQTVTGLSIKLNYSDLNTVSTYTVKYNVKTSGGQLVTGSEVVLSSGSTNAGVIPVDKTIDMSTYTAGEYVVTLWTVNGHNLRTNDVVYNIKITKPTSLAITNTPSQQTATSLPIKINYSDLNTVSTYTVKYNVKTSGGQLVTGAEVVLSTGTTNGGVIPVDKSLDMSTYNTGDYIVTLWATNGHNLRTNDVVYNVKVSKPLSLAMTNAPSQQIATSLPIKLNYSDANTVSTYTVKYNVKTSGGQLVTGPEVILSSATTIVGVNLVDKTLDMSTYAAGDYVVTLWTLNGHNLRTNDVVYNVKITKPTTLAITNTPSQQTATSLPIKLNYSDINTVSTYTVKYNVKTTGGQLVTGTEVVLSSGTTNGGVVSVDKALDMSTYTAGEYIVTLWTLNGHNLRTNDVVYNVKITKPTTLAITNVLSQQTASNLSIKINYSDTNTVSTYTVKYNVKTSGGQLVTAAEEVLSSGSTNGGLIPVDKILDMSTYNTGDYIVTLWAINGHTLRTNDVVYNVKVAKPLSLAITNTPSQQTATSLPIKLNYSDANTVSTYTVKYNVKTSGGQLVTAAEVVLSTGTTNGALIPVDKILDMSTYNTGDYIVTLWATNGHNLRTNDVVYNVKVAKPLSLAITNTTGQQTATTLPIKLNYTDANTASTYTVKYYVKTSGGQLVTSAEVVLSTGTTNGAVISIDKTLDMSTYNTGDYIVTLWTINGHSLRTNDVVYNVKVAKPLSLAITNAPSQQIATSLPIKINYSDANTASTYTIKYNVKTSLGQLITATEVVLSTGTTNGSVIPVDKALDMSAYNTGDYIVTLWAINGHGLRTNDAVYNVKIAKPTTLAITNTISQQTATILPIKLNYSDVNTVSTYTVKYNVKTSGGQLLTAAEVVLSTGTTNSGVIPIDKTLDMSAYNTGDYIVTLWSTNGHNLRTNDVVYTVKTIKELSIKPFVNSDIAINTSNVTLTTSVKNYNIGETSTVKYVLINAITGLTTASGTLNSVVMTAENVSTATVVGTVPFENIQKGAYKFVFWTETATRKSSEESFMIIWNNQLQIMKAPIVKPSISTEGVLKIQFEPNNTAFKAYKLIINEKEVDNKGLPVIAGQGHWFTLGSDSSYTLTGLNVNQTYNLKVKGRYLNLTESDFSTTHTLKGIGDEPSGISGIKILPDTTSAYVSWNPSRGAVHYEFKLFKEKNMISQFQTTEPQITLKDLIEDTYYYIEVKAINLIGAGQGYKESFKTDYRIPVGTISSNLSIVSNYDIIVKWEPDPNAFGYDIEADGEIYTIRNATEFKHKGLTQGSRHVYRIRTKSQTENGPWSVPVVLMTTKNPVTVNFKNGKITESHNNIILNWDSVPNASNYLISFNNGPFIDNGTSLFCIKSSLIADTQYDFVVKAVNPLGTSVATFSGSARTKLLPVPVISTIEEVPTGLKITWKPVVGAEYYTLKQNDTVIVAKSFETTYLATNVKSLNNINFSLMAVSERGTSKWSSPINIEDINEVLQKPKGLSACGSSNNIAITWDITSVNEVIAQGLVYEIEIDGVIWEALELGKYIHEGLEPFSEHTYRVRVKNLNTVSEWTDKIVVQTLPGVPMKPKNVAIRNMTYYANLTWDGDPSVTSYEIGIQQPDGTFNVISISNRNYYNHKTLAMSEQVYKIRAINMIGSSEWSQLLVNSAIKAECTRGKELDLGLTMSNIVDFDQYELQVTYNPDAIDVIDLCAYTTEKELKEGVIEGTDIEIVSYAPGKIVFKVKKGIKNGTAWSGVINNIKFVPKETGGSFINYTVFIEN